MPYREHDRVLSLEQELERANERIAELSIEVETLRAHGRGEREKSELGGVVFRCAAVGTWGGFLLSMIAFLATENVGLVMFFGLLGLLGGVVYGLIGTIRTSSFRP